MRRLPALLLAVLGVLALLAPTAVAKKKPGHHSKTAKVCKTNKHGKGCAPTLRVLGINDFHGNLEPPTGSGGRIGTGPDNQTVNAGGAAFLGTWVKKLEAEKPNSMFVGAGDLIGASPLISGLFHDEPTIESLNAMGMDASSVGNHEFDEGITELQRMQNGGCRPEPEGCQDGDGFAGAAFQYLAANVRYDGSQNTVFPPYVLKKVGGVKVAFIGLTLTGTPLIVTPDGVRGLAFDDEATTINAAVHELQKTQKVRSFVVLIHQGGQQNPPYAKRYQDVNGCENPTGDIFSIVPKLSRDVDVVMSAHTHQPYICRVGGKLVTSAASFGRLITKLDLTFSSRTKDVTGAQASNVIVTRTVKEDPAQQKLVAKYKALSAPIANRVVGSTTAPITRDSSPAGESALGDVIADAQLDATSPANLGGSVIAFMNPGGIRADLPAGQVTYNDLYTSQPFANTLVVKTLSGAQIKALLEQQFDNPGAGEVRLLQVSRGFTYSYDLTRPSGSRVDAASIRIGGAAVDPGASYRVTMNSFLATGGDGFSVFNQGTDQLGGAVDIDALEAYFKAHSPVPPGPQNRVTKTG